MTNPTLIMMNGTGSATSFPRRAQRGYYAEVQPESLDEQSRLIEQVMQFALDTLGVQHLDIRVFGVGQKSCCACEQSLPTGAHYP